MDPQFFDRINALQNFQNQQANRANLEQLQANQAELAALREQLAEEANKPQCPHCGGPSEKGFGSCKNCGQEVIWYGHFVGKLGDRPKLEMLMKEYELEIKRQKQFEIARQQAAAEEAEVERVEAYNKEGEGCFLGCGIILAIAAFGFVLWLARRSGDI